jgi:hypothetical protein
MLPKLFLLRVWGDLLFFSSLIEMSKGHMLDIYLGKISEAIWQVLSIHRVRRVTSKGQAYSSNFVSNSLCQEAIKALENDIFYLFYHIYVLRDGGVLYTAVCGSSISIVSTKQRIAEIRTIRPTVALQLHGFLKRFVKVSSIGVGE